MITYLTYSKLHVRKAYIQFTLWLQHKIDAFDWKLGAVIEFFQENNDEIVTKKTSSKLVDEIVTKLWKKNFIKTYVVDIPIIPSQL